MNIIAKFTQGYNFKAIFDWKPGLELIFDRTQADVNRVIELNNKLRNGTISEEEMEEWETNLKGAINKVDLERIVYYINYFSNKLNIPVTAQTVPEIPTESWYTTLGNNLSLLRAGYQIHSSTPPVPLHPYNTYKKWNDIEKILFDLYEIYQNQYEYYAGGELYMNNPLI